MRVEKYIQGTQYWKEKMKIRLGDGDPEDVKIYLLTSIVIWNNFAEPSWLGQI